MFHSDNGTKSRKATKKVQYVANGAHVDSHDSFVNDDDICLLTIHSKSSDNKTTIHPVLNSRQVPMEVDTGATTTVMPEHTLPSLGKPKLNSCDLILKTYNGETLKVKGIAKVEVSFNPTLSGQGWHKHISLIDLKSSLEDSRFADIVKYEIISVC